MSDEDFFDSYGYESSEIDQVFESFLKETSSKNDSNQTTPNEEEEEEEEQMKETIQTATKKIKGPKNKRLPNEEEETNQKIKKRIKKPRTQVDLTNEGRQLRDSIYNLIKNKVSKKVRKNAIFCYHKKARENDNRITVIKRKENRNVNIYFNNHSKERKFIIEQFKQMQDDGIINYGAYLKKHTKLSTSSINELV